MPRPLNPASGIASEARPVLLALAPGESATFDLYADTHYWRQQQRQQLGSTAQAKLGKGNYVFDSKSRPGFVTITRRAAT